MKKAVLVLAVACVAMPAWAGTESRTLPAGYELIDGIAALVEGEVITLYELMSKFVFVEVLGANIADAEKRKEWAEKKKQDLLNEEINTILVLREAKKLGLSGSATRVNQHIDRIKRHNRWSDEQLMAYLQQQGFTKLAEYREHVRKEMIKSQMLNFKVGSRIKPRAEEIERIFKRDYYGGTQQDEILVQHILIRVPGLTTVPKLRLLQKRIDHVLNLVLTEQKTFEEAAREFSEDPGTRNLGGEIGWIKRGSLDPDFELSAFKLSTGQVSGVIQTQIGYHIVRVLGKRQVDIDDPKKVRQRIRMELHMERQSAAWEQWMKELRGKYHVDIRL
jgi:parvulin-like peptidyl-prolyl isomerase